MKTLKSEKAWFLSILFSLVICFCLCSEMIAGEQVQRAYALRMNGKADSAKIILDKILSDNAKDAAARFELARTIHHIGLGNPRALFSSLDKMQRSAEKAVKLDSKNITYTFYNANLHFLKAYVALMRDKSAAAGKIKSTVKAFESVLDLKPDYHEARLFIIEALTVPKNMGGDPEKAAAYARQLEKNDPIFGAKAKELILPENKDRTEYWHAVLKKHPKNSDVLEQLGKAYLYKDDLEKGTQYLEAAIANNPEKHLVLLDLARYFFMRSKQNPEKAQQVLPKAEAAIIRFLDGRPSGPLRAFALNLLGSIKQDLNQHKEASDYREQAAKIDPHVSKAFGVPPALLFSQPGEISRYHGYFFRPF